MSTPQSVTRTRPQCPSCHSPDIQNVQDVEEEHSYEVFCGPTGEIEYGPKVILLTVYCENDFLCLNCGWRVEWNQFEDVWEDLVRESQDV